MVHLYNLYELSSLKIKLFAQQGYGFIIIAIPVKTERPPRAFSSVPKRYRHITTPQTHKAKSTTNTCKYTIPQPIPNLPAALFFFFGPSVAPPAPTVIVPTTTTPVPPAARLNTSPPTVTVSPVLKVCPPMTKLLTGTTL